MYSISVEYFVLHMLFKTESHEHDGDEDVNKRRENTTYKIECK